MIQRIHSETETEIVYPDSDGQPLSDNTKQFRWIVTIKENLEILFAAVADVFVAGDLLWYPLEGDNKTRQAPDVMVVFGRTKGDRGSYKQWQEANIAPQVVFEILSPGNTAKEMVKKYQFYEQYGVEEYYIFDPDKITLSGWVRAGALAESEILTDRLSEIEQINGWISPRLDIRLQLQGNTLEIYRPDNRRFLTPVELDQLREQERQRAEQERQRAEDALAQLEAEKQRYQALLERLRDRGIDPEQL